MINFYSQAMLSTWFFHEETNTLFDCGEGVTYTLGGKIWAIKNILLTHGHLDHIGGLPTLLFARASGKGDNLKPLNVYYPKGDHGILRIIDYINNFSADVAYGVIEKYLRWCPTEENTTISIARNKYCLTFATKHIKDRLTLGYQIFEKRKKLKEQYRSLTGTDIINLVKQGTKVSDELDYTLLTYSGDTIPIEQYGNLTSGILMHECTFINKEDIKYNVHSCLDDVIELVKRFPIQELVLYHFSMRYSIEEVVKEVYRILFEGCIKIPVSIVYGSQKIRVF